MNFRLCNKTTTTTAIISLQILLMKKKKLKMKMRNILLLCGSFDDWRCNLMARLSLKLPQARSLTHTHAHTHFVGQVIKRRRTIILSRLLCKGRKTWLKNVNEKIRVRTNESKSFIFHLESIQVNKVKIGNAVFCFKVRNKNQRTKMNKLLKILEYRTSLLCIINS